MRNAKLKEANEFFEKLKVNGSLKRLGKLFHTRDNGYIYDLGTGKVLQCNDTEYAILENIFENNGTQSLSALDMEKNMLDEHLDNLMQVIETEKLLQAPPLTEFSSAHGKFDRIKSQIENNLEQITLELTEQCNLRCKYCIYSDENESFREFGTRNMTWEIAKKAIDYGMQHSGKELAVTFYGGEPLLKFDLLKKCVEYTKENAGNKLITYSMTTNLTLMTKEIAQYLASVERFTVVCSLDGPKEVHDANRLMVSGKGSFDKAIRGLKFLVEAYGERAATYLSLSMVMTLPVTDEKLKKMQHFFDELDWLPTKLVKKISYVASSQDRSERLLKKSQEKLTDDEAGFVNPLADWSQNNTVFEENISPDQIFTSDFMQSQYLKIHKRMIVDDPVGWYGLGGCCVPGARRLYITAMGDFSLCEKIGNAPFIGNVETGIDFDSIKKHYIDDYVNEALRLCENCWAIRFCKSCYVDCYDGNGFRTEFKMDQCDASVFDSEQALVAYHELLERHPEQLEHLNDITLS